MFVFAMRIKNKENTTNALPTIQAWTSGGFMHPDIKLNEICPLSGATTQAWKPLCGLYGKTRKYGRMGECSRQTGTHSFQLGTAKPRGKSKVIEFYTKVSSPDILELKLYCCKPCSIWSIKYPCILMLYFYFLFFL